MPIWPVGVQTLVCFQYDFIFWLVLEIFPNEKNMCRFFALPETPTFPRISKENPFTPKLLKNILFCFITLNNILKIFLCFLKCDFSRRRRINVKKISRSFIVNVINNISSSSLIEINFKNRAYRCVVFAQNLFICF